MSYNKIYEIESFLDNTPVYHKTFQTSFYFYFIALLFYVIIIYHNFIYIYIIFYHLLCIFIAEIT